MYSLEVCKILGEHRDNHGVFRKYTQEYDLPTEVFDILDGVDAYYDTYTTEEKIDWENFKAFFNCELHPTLPKAQKDMYATMIDNIIGTSANPNVISRLNQLTLADAMEQAVEDLRDQAGDAPLVQIGEVIAKYQADALKTEDYFVDVNAVEFVKNVLVGHGIMWRLSDLNKVLGQIHEGDFYLIGKRPETGGTTFLCSEFTHMLNQLPAGRDAIIFNNEEGGDKIGLRLLMSALNLTSQEILANPVQVQADYEKFLNGRRIYIFDKPAFSTQDMTNVLNSTPNIFLIGINVLDKISGYNKSGEVDRYRKLAEFARNTAKNYGAVFAIAQAGDSAEGVQYPTLSMLYGSKTAVQGECDGIIMIGKDHDSPAIRYINVVKNKKPTTGNMIPQLRHAKFSCAFDEERGRFNTMGAIT